MLYRMSGMDFFDTFSLFQIFFYIGFAAVLVIILVQAFRGLKTWNKNNNSPRLSVPASVVAKRTNVSYHRHANAGDATGAHGYHTDSSTTYYATFQVESGDRMEFHINGQQYGMLAEGDHGKLSFQGTRFLNFERQ